MSAPLLQASHLSLRFGGLSALRNVSFAMKAGEIVGIIGPNGAGKSSLFNTVSGLYPPTAGHLLFQGRPLRRKLSRQAIFACGLGIVLFAFLATLLGANIDRMFAVVIKEGFVQAPAGGSLYAERLKEYLRDQPQAEKQLIGSRVLSADGKSVFGTYPTLALGREAAKHLKKTVAVQRQGERAGGRLRLYFLVGLMVGTGVCWSLLRQTSVSSAFVASQGISRTFQNNRLFSKLTVFQNIQIAQERLGHDPNRGPWALLQATLIVFLLRLVAVASELSLTSRIVSFLGLLLLGLELARRHRAAAREADLQKDISRKELLSLLEAIGLAGQADKLAGTLSYGERRILEIGRAWATRPTLLLLDEPAAGMNALETQKLEALVRAIRDRGTAVLLIEHDMPLVMGLCDRVLVLDRGEIIAEGLPAEIQKNKRVIDAYLGTGLEIAQTVGQTT